MALSIIIIAILISLMVLYKFTNKVSKPYLKWTRDDFELHLLRHDKIIDLCPSMRGLYVDSIKSILWNPSIDFNGCSIVQDYAHPCPVCWMHDFLWMTGQGGYISDRLFKKLMIASGMNKKRAWMRWFFVRLGWIFYFKWKHQQSRNLNELSPEFIAVIKELGLSKRLN